MIFVRSLFFQIALYGLLACMTVLFLPLLLLPPRFMMMGGRLFARTLLAAMRVTAGLDLRIVGQQAPIRGACIVACKHQSMWETMALFALVHDPVFVMKESLMRIPLLGLILRKTGAIGLDRAKPEDALNKLISGAKRASLDNRPIVIFPEGTRQPYGAPPAYKPGLMALYKTLNLPIIPVGLNSGKFWRRRKFLILPGTVRLEVCEPIPAGLPRAQAYRMMQEAIEEASYRED